MWTSLHLYLGMIYIDIKRRYACRLNRASWQWLQHVLRRFMMIKDASTLFRIFSSWLSFCYFLSVICINLSFLCSRLWFLREKVKLQGNLSGGNITRRKTSWPESSSTSLFPQKDMKWETRKYLTLTVVMHTFSRSQDLRRHQLFRYNCVILKCSLKNMALFDSGRHSSKRIVNSRETRLFLRYHLFFETWSRREETEAGNFSELEEH